MSDFASARQNMVDSQLRPNKVTDRSLLDAFAEVPREMFVPKPMRGIAYIDEDVEVALGRYLTEPMVLARLLQAAEITPEDVVLELGCGTGYGPAILARLASTVVSVEPDQALAEQATATLLALGVDNVAVVRGTLAEGYPQQAPYDVIVVTGRAAAIPAGIIDQLGEGGRLVAVEGARDMPGRAVLLARYGRTLSRRVLFDAATPYLPGLEPEESFVF